MDGIRISNCGYTLLVETNGNFGVYCGKAVVCNNCGDDDCQRGVCLYSVDTDVQNGFVFIKSEDEIVVDKGVREGTYRGQKTYFAPGYKGEEDEVQVEKYTCCGCGWKCVLTVSDKMSKPSKCPYGMFSASNEDLSVWLNDSSI